MIFRAWVYRKRGGVFQSLSFRAAASSYSDDLDDEDIREQQFVKKSGWMSSGAASPVSRKKGVDNADNLEVNIRVGYPSLYCAH